MNSLTTRKKHDTTISSYSANSKQSPKKNLQTVKC